MEKTETDDNNSEKKNVQENENSFNYKVIRDSLKIEKNEYFDNYLNEVFVDLSNRSEENLDFSNIENKIDNDDINKENENQQKKNFLKSKSPKKISKIVFADYFKMPKFIFEKLFLSIDKDKDNSLNQKEFKSAMNTLFLGTFYQTVEFIFNIFDFNKDGKITKGDVKILLSYIPNNLNNNNKYQLKSLENINKIIEETFPKDQEYINLKTFCEIIEQKKSDIYLELLLFLYSQKPFSPNTVNECKFSKKKNTHLHNLSNNIAIKSLFYNSNNNNYNNINNHNINNFFNNTLLINNNNLRFNKKVKVITKTGNNNIYSSPIKDKNHNNISYYIKNKNAYSNVKKYNETKIQNGNVRLSNSRSLNKIQIKKKQIVPSSPNVNGSPILRMNKEFQSNEINSSINTVIPINFTEKKNDSPSPEIKNKNNDNNNNINNNTLYKGQKFSSLFNLTNNNLILNLEENSNSSLENIVYKFDSNEQKTSLNLNKFKKFYLVLHGVEISLYNNEKKEELILIHNLSGTFIYEGESLIKGKNSYHSIIIQISKKSDLIYYFENKNIRDKWLTVLKNNIGYQNFSDFYEILEIIGQGNFGVVRLAVHKKTNEKVAVKIINKNRLKLSEYELIRGELDTMKLLRHSNLVKLLDHFENSEFIYIVMEYLAGGDLKELMDKSPNKKLSEKEAAIIIKQISLGIKFLNNYGVIHRDIKPSNVMLLEPGNINSIKIIDFGLTKTLGDNEKVAEGMGTLFFVAPEVIQRNPYNKTIDVWSIGVVFYYLVSGILPFFDVDDKNVANKIIYCPLTFPKDNFKGISKECIDLITKCLEKNPNKRVNIDYLINSDWLKSYT